MDTNKNLRAVFTVVFVLLLLPYQPITVAHAEEVRQAEPFLRLYDSFQDGELDTLKWYWKGKTPSGISETDGKLQIRAAPDINNPKIYFA